MMGIRRKILFTLGVMLVFFMLPARVMAGSAVIQFSTANPEIQKGDVFTVVCQVTSTDAFMDTEFQIEYDADLIQFLGGGRKVMGDNGLLTVSSTDNETATNKKTFSLQFVANKKGDAVFSVRGTATVTDRDGNSFSSSSNRMVVTVVKKGKKVDEGAAASAAPAPEPTPTPEPALATNNKLKELELAALDMTPAFASDREQYEARVGHDTDTLYVSFRTADDKARVRLKGNKNLKEGVNNVSVIVTAESGSTRTYRIAVTRETAAETAERQKETGQTQTGRTEGKEGKDIAFAVTKEGERILLKNSYEFEVLDPSALSEIPAGYVLSAIEISGFSIPAFTMENDLDNNYLLLYLKGPAGEGGIYQYDRAEQTLQRYTGNMIDKINKSAGAVKGASGLSVSNYVLLGIIIGLVVIVLSMLIAMLKMALKKREV